MQSQVDFRAARKEDARAIAELIDMSSDGVATLECVEEAERSPGAEPQDIGAQIYRGEQGDYSYRNCVIAEQAGEVAGMLLSFPMPPPDPHNRPQAPPFDGSDVFATYKYLEAPDTWYVCGVALYPQHRGRGIGRRLMGLAHRQAGQRGYDRVSLVAFAKNEVAVRLYQRLGYRVIDQAPIVPHPLIRCTGEALLMVCEL